MQQPNLIPLKTAKIIWHEGTGEFDGQTFTSWKSLQKAFDKIHRHHSGEGYTKVKIALLWEDGTGITDRVDVADTYDNYTPKRGTIGQYIQKYIGLKHLPLSFEDQPAPDQTPKKTAKSAQIKRKAPQTETAPTITASAPEIAPNKPKISHNLTFDQLCAIQLNPLLN